MSRLFSKTNRNELDLGSVNATLLTKAGFIDQTMAGVYSFLPLGWRVLTKIENIVRQEMDKLGREVLLPAISPKQLWQTTGRLETVSVLMKTKGANKLSRKVNKAEYVLNSTHEELVTPIAKLYNRSWKDLPCAVYQIQSKFRNEPRSRSGLLRGREFRMKDLYSFHSSEADLKEYYEKVKQAYGRVFARLGLDKDTLVVLASGGDFTPDYSHEFQTRCDTGEDWVFWAKRAGIAYNREVAPSKAPLFGDPDAVLRPKKDVFGKGIVGVEGLAKFLKVPVESTTKTLIFETDAGEVIVAAVRGGYEINEEKLTKAAGCRSLRLADEKTVMEVTGAAVGYAGVVNLSPKLRLFFDDSMRGRRNFETGTNKTNYHTINVNFGRDLPNPKRFWDIKLAREGDFYPDTGEKYEVFRASEVGNIFPLNTKFSQAFGYTYTDQQGRQRPVYMGSYGIGTSRVMGVLVEKFHDERGIIWPAAAAPYDVQLLSLGDVQERGKAVYDRLTADGVEVLWDDRDESAGVKFADADLIGIPVRLVVSAKTGLRVEWKLRTKSASELVDLEEICRRLGRGCCGGGCGAGCCGGD